MRKRPRDVTVKEALGNLFFRGTTGRILSVVRNLFSFGARGRYHKAVSFSFRNMRVPLPYSPEGNGPTALKIDKLFVELRIAPSAESQKFNPQPVTAAVLAKVKDIWAFLRFANEDDGENMALVVSGPPGSGKTTLLQFIAFVLADNRQGRYKIGSYTPIFISLRDHLKRIANNPGVTLGELSQEFFTRSNPDLKLPAGWFEKILGQGRSLVLLDGLNEAGSDEQCVKIARWIDDQVRLYPNCRFIVTSRPESYQAAPLSRALVVRILPFNSAQVASLMKKLSLCGDLIRGPKNVSGLMKRLVPGTASRFLTSNPLTLTMIASLDRDRDPLPGQRANIYGP